MNQTVNDTLEKENDVIKLISKELKGHLKSECFVKMHTCHQKQISWIIQLVFHADQYNNKPELENYTQGPFSWGTPNITHYCQSQRSSAFHWVLCV